MIAAACAAAAGCGGRVARPVALEQSFDGALSCAHLSGEKANNEKRLAELKGESRDKDVNNLGLLVASPLFLDFSDTQRKEAEAIYARNARLDALMAEKGCAPASAPPVEEAETKAD